MSVFSIRHRRALAEGKLAVKLDERLRGRLWRLMGSYNESWHYQPDPSDNWSERTDCFEQVEKALLDTSGASKLKFGITNTEMSLKSWFTLGRDVGVLDGIEFFYLQVDESRRPAFSADLNRVLGEEDASWRLLEGQFVPLDSVFVHEQIVASSQEALHTVRFEGAAHELLDAQHDLTDGQVRGAIHNAGSSFESAMKAALDRDDHLTAKQLIDSLLANDYFEHLPEDLRGGFATQVMMALPWMRNHLGGHGQGKEKQTLPEPYARLALGLAAAFNEFVVGLAVERDASLVKVTDQRKSDGAADISEIQVSESDFQPAPIAAGDDDIPF